MTPVEAEELAGLQNNKNWKKSLLTTYQVCGGGGQQCGPATSTYGVQSEVYVSR